MLEYIEQECHLGASVILLHQVALVFTRQKSYASMQASSPVRAAATEGGNSGAPELRSSFLWKYTDTRRMGGDGSTGVWYRT